MKKFGLGNGYILRIHFKAIVLMYFEEVSRILSFKKPNEIRFFGISVQDKIYIIL